MASELVAVEGVVVVEVLVEDEVVVVIAVVYSKELKYEKRRDNRTREIIGN